MVSQKGGGREEVRNFGVRTAPFGRSSVRTSELSSLKDISAVQTVNITREILCIPVTITAQAVRHCKPKMGG